MVAGNHGQRVDSHLWFQSFGKKAHLSEWYLIGTPSYKPLWSGCGRGHITKVVAKSQMRILKILVGSLYGDINLYHYSDLRKCYGGSFCLTSGGQCSGETKNQELDVEGTMTCKACGNTL